MNDFSIRRRLLEDGKSEHEVDDLLSEMAEQSNDDAQDRKAELHFEEQKWT